MATSSLGKAIRRTLLRLEGPAATADGQLLERFAAQCDEAAFEELVRRHGPMVMRLCRRLLRENSDVEDVFQATFVVLARRAGSVRKHQSVASWLYKVAYRIALRPAARPIAGGSTSSRWARRRRTCRDRPPARILARAIYGRSWTRN